MAYDTSHENQHTPALNQRRRRDMVKPRTDVLGCCNKNVRAP